jgi:hypothetical protein
MMILKRLVLPLLVLAVAFSTLAQQSSTPTAPLQPTRDAQAITVVQQSIMAMGGAAALGQVQNSVVTATIVNPAVLESIAQGTAESFTWTYAGSEFRLEDSGTSGAHVLVSSGGSPQDYHDGAWYVVSPISVRTNLPYHIPALALFGETQNQGYSLIFIGSTTINGKTATHIQTRDDSDTTGHLFTPQDWYFDPATALPLRVEYQIPMSLNPSDSFRASIDFSNFQAVSGILIPFQLSIAEGPVSMTSTVTSAAFNTAVNSSAFAPSDGGAQ